MISLKIDDPIFSQEKIANKEYHVGNFLPYMCHWNSNTLLANDGSFITTIKLKGFSFETADDEDLDIRKESRNNLFKGIPSSNLVLYFHTVRKKHSAYPGGKFPNIFSKILDDQWKMKHNPEFVFCNEHYITIVRKPSAEGGIAKIGKALKKVQYATDKKAEEKDMLDSYNELEEVRDRILTAFANYKPKLLGVKETSYGLCSEMLEFLGSIVNCGFSQQMLVPNTNIANYIPTHRLYFGKKAIEAAGPTDTRYVSMISVKEYRPTTHVGILDGFLQLPFELVITQTFTFIDRMIAIAKMQLQQRRLVQSQDVAVSQIQEINSALDSAMSGEFGFGRHHLSVMCIAKDVRSLETYSSQAVVTFSNCGITAVREKMNMAASFWAQFPGNDAFAIRSSIINSLNLASFVSLHNYPSGKIAGNHWGDAITTFNTTSGTPFFFSFHARDVGHTMIIGPTGAGKTVLMNFLCAQAQKVNPRMFFFDKDRGAEVFIRAIEGRHTIIDPARPTGFNPLQLEETNENRTFLIEWLKTLVTVNGEVCTSEDMSKLSSAIEGNYRLPKEQRILRNIAPFLGLDTPGSLSNRLKMWHGNGPRARLFDNETDMLDFSSARTFGFEMAELLKDKLSLSPALLYLFHKINLSLDGTPTMVVLDEAWALIDNPVFGPKIKDWLKVMRKLNAMVIFATQSVEDASKSSISDTLVQQTATQIFLPNLKATETYKTVFMLSAREFLLIKTTDPASRFFLVKQDNDAVVARIDLGGMDDVINVLSGRADTIRILDEIRKEVGEDPADWLPIFAKRVK